MNIKEIILKRGRVRITIRKFPKGYLATVDYLDKDESVEFGCSGEFSNNPQDAALNALDYYHDSFKNASAPSFSRLIKKLNNGYKTNKRKKEKLL